jgi:two-component system, cell cycle sensor histidine kinase and response regulator CckA
MGTAAERSAERVVLVVEDDASVRQYTARVLADAGFRVLVAYDGEEAMTLLTSLGPTVVRLVLSDVEMPRRTGLELAAAIAERWPNLPVLLVSGQPLDYWNGPFLPKPFTPEALIAAVQHLLPPLESRVGRAFR